ncbi:DUF3349 domain-containing protein [Brachybacterium nesterenkovii]|nr:DUF3349 domain-containing protein [Brachybacterium nesterenkovii]
MPTSNPLAPVLGWLHKGYPEGVPPKDFYPLLALLARTLSDEELDEIVATLIDESTDGPIHERDVHQAIEQVKQAPPNQSDVRDVAARLAAAGWPLGDPDAPRLGERSPAAAGAFGRSVEDAEAVPDASSTVAAPDASSTGAAADAPSAVGTSRAGAASSTADADGDDGADGIVTGTAGAAGAGPAENPAPGLVQRISDWFDVGFPEGVPATDRVPIMALLRRRLTDEEAEQIARRLEREADGQPVAASAAEALIDEVTHDGATPHELERVAARLAARGWPLASDRREN